MTPLKPGWQSSEVQLSAAKVLVTSVIAFCSAFGVGIPRWLQPDAPWVAMAALAVGGAVAIVSMFQRTSLKKQQQVLTATTGTATPGSFVPVTVDTQAGYTLIEVCIAILILVIAVVVLFHYVH